MSFTNFQKTIALVSGVLVLSVAVGYIVLAWDGPPGTPPTPNAPAPINVGSDAQTKAGNLTVSALTTSGGKLYLNNSGFEGDIERVDEIIGHNDLQLRDSANETKINLDYTNNNEIEFYTNGWKRMKIEKDGDLYKQGDLYIENGDLHVKDLSDCFLEATVDGKVKCYTGGGIPGGDKFLSQETSLVDWDVATDFQELLSESYFLTAVDDPGQVIKISINVYVDHNNCGFGFCSYFHFYINKGTAEEIAESFEIWRPNSPFVKTWYYWLKKGDTLDIDFSAGKGVTTGSISVSDFSYRNQEVDYVFSEGDILYYYDANKGTTGLMHKKTNQFFLPVTTKLILLGDGVEVVMAVE